MKNTNIGMIFDNLPESYVYQYSQDTDGKPCFIYISAGVERIHGIKTADILSDADLLRALIDPEQMPALLAEEANSLKNMNDFQMDLRMRDLNNHWKWIKVCCHPHRESERNILWDCLATDITKHKKAEIDSQAAEQQLSDIIEFLPDATIVVDEEKRVVAWNRACEMITGVKKQEVLGQGDYAYAKPFFGKKRPILLDMLDQPSHELENAYKYIVRKGEIIFGESFIPRLHNGNGAHFWAAAAPLFDPKGRRSGTIEVIRDITEQKKIEHALRESEQKYRELVELANSIILRWNSKGIITFMNEFGLKFFGYSIDEILGRSVTETIVPSTESGGRDLHGLMAEISADPKAFEQNINENIRRNGDRVWIAWTNKVVLNDKGEMVEVLSIGTDITERKQAEDQIRQLHDELRNRAEELELRVAERTAELAIARDRAEEADRLKSAFLATMSHELRTPLNSIIGFTGIILQGLAGPLNDEQRKQLEMVKNSARHLLALINEVLDISKIEAGQLEVSFEEFNLRESIEKVVSIVKPLAEKKGLILIVEMKPEIYSWNSDQQRVEQILINLLNNAIKFTDRGDIRLSVEIITDVLSISVIDTGIGIKQDDLRKLFQPFRQINTGLSRNHEGTGLGLAICQRLAKLLGGEIRVESVWGKGSTFKFILPNKSREKI